MSLVTTVTIITSEYGPSLDSHIYKINKEFPDRLINPFKQIELSKQAAGSRYPQRRFIIAGINYLDQESFVNFVKNLEMDNTILILANEDDPYQIYTSGNNYGEPTSASLNQEDWS